MVPVLLFAVRVSANSSLLAFLFVSGNGNSLIRRSGFACTSNGTRVSWRFRGDGMLFSLAMVVAVSQRRDPSEYQSVETYNVGYTMVNKR